MTASPEQVTVLPRNLDAEKALLGHCLYQPHRIGQLGSKLRELMTHPVHKLLAGTFLDLNRRGIQPDPVTVHAEIDRDENVSRGYYDDAGPRILSESIDAGIGTRFDGLVALLEEQSHKRAIVQAAAEMTAMSQNGSTVVDIARVFRDYAKRMDLVLSQADGIRIVDVEACMTAELAPVPWIVDGWLGEGDLIIFGGEWATGKSVVAADLAIAVACGLPWLGRLQTSKQGNVLVCDEENNARNVLRRLARMFRGRGIENGADVPIRYLSKNSLRLDNPKGLATLEREIQAYKPILVILDSLIRFHGASENDNTEIAAVFAEITTLATRYGCAFVVLDHMRKPTKDDDRFDSGHRIRGAGDKAGVGDGVWTLEGDRETDQRVLSCRKNRWEDSLPPSITTRWVVSEDETAAWIEAKDAALSAEISVVTLLERFPGGRTATELYELMAAQGTARRTAQRVIRKLLKGGQINVRKDGQRGLRYWVGTLQIEAV